MPKWQLVDQGVQGLNVYRAGKIQGNQQMMQQGLDLVAQASNALRGITDVQQARQQMEFGRAAEARTQQLFPLQMQAQRQLAEAGQIDLEKQRRQEQEYAEVTRRMGTSPGMIDLIATLKERGLSAAEAEQKLGTLALEQKTGLPGIQAGRRVAEERRLTEEAVTGERRAVAQRPYVEAEAAAAGAKATYEKLSALADISNMPAEEITRRAETESREWKARLGKGIAVNEMDYIVGDKQRSIELVKEQINALKKRNQLYDAQILEALLAQQTGDMDVLKEIRALTSDIQSAYMALARLEAGEDIFDQLAKIGSQSGVKIDMQGMTRDTASMNAIKQNIIAHISILRSLINRHGYQYDNTSIPPTFRTLSPGERQMPPGGGATVQYEQYRKDLPPSAPQTYQEPGRTAPLGPPSQGQTDIEAMLKAFGL